MVSHMSVLKIVAVNEDRGRFCFLAVCGMRFAVCGHLVLWWLKVAYCLVNIALSPVPCFANRIRHPAEKVGALCPPPSPRLWRTQCALSPEQDQFLK